MNKSAGAGSVSCPVPDNETDRLNALRELEILDSDPEEAFDRITRLAAYITDSPISAVSLIDEARQWFKSIHGLDVSETPREVAFCAHAILGEGVMVVPDATRDERFANNPLVTSTPDIRFYAGAPLKSSTGFNLGTLCVIDTKPKDIPEDQLQALSDLALLVMEQMEMRLAAQHLRKAYEREQEQAKALKAAKEKAERASQAKTDFLSSMSHELRTPLNAILGFAQVLEFNPKEPLSDTQLDHVSHIKKGGEHLLGLINDILDLARIEAGKVEMSIEPVPLVHVIEECVSLISTVADQRNVSIDFNRDQISGTLIRADHTRLIQVFLNLLSNAVKYNRENGKVSFSFIPHQFGTLRIGIADTGVGIPEEQYGKVFQAFDRLGAEETDVEGYGIGLTVTKELIHQMGGTIEFESELGTGTTFWIELPLDKENLSKSNKLEFGDDETAMAHLRGLKANLLYVEDDLLHAKLLEALISKTSDIDMTVAPDGHSGIEAARAIKPDIIFVDIKLPDMEGFDVTRSIRDIPELKDTPIIALTAAAKQSDMDKGYAAGFTDYLTKPIQFGDVAAAIVKALPRSQR